MYSNLFFGLAMLIRVFQGVGDAGVNTSGKIHTCCCLELTKGLVFSTIA